MNPELQSTLIQLASRGVAYVVRTAMEHSYKPKSATEEPIAVAMREPAPQPRLTEVKPPPKIEPEKLTEVVNASGAPARQDLDYRWECVMKHLGGASVLLREAYERANDDGPGPGTAEKLMEAMNEHSGMEADLEHMLVMPEAKPVADKLLSGARAFRAAAWKAGLPRGSGSKDDIADARTWNDILYQTAFNEAKKNPGQECILSGM